MSWQDKQENEQTASKQFELLQEDMDRLMVAQNQLYKEIQDNTRKLTKETHDTRNDLRYFSQEHKKEIDWINEQKSIISELQKDLTKTIKDRETKTVIVKKWVELAFFVVIVVILYQALTTSLWQTLGFKELYRLLLHTYPNFGGYVVLTVYIILNLGALIYLVKTIISSSRYWN